MFSFQVLVHVCFDSSSIQKLFDKKLREEEESLKYEGYENYKHHNEGTMDYESTELRRGGSESRTAARAAIKINSRYYDCSHV